MLVQYDRTGGSVAVISGIQLSGHSGGASEAAKCWKCFRETATTVTSAIAEESSGYAKALAPCGSHQCDSGTDEAKGRGSNAE